VVGAAGTRAVTRRVTAIRRQLQPGELVVVERSRQLDAPPGAVEHFGFVDGLSQPVFVTDDGPPAHGWDSRTPLANVLAPEPGPSGAPRHHGSYLVYRKIEQDTAAFARREAQLTALLGGAAPPGSDVPDAGAWLVGRHRDGTPLVSHATAAGPAAGAAAFDYHDDRDGDRCPLHAHVRKMNPRQSSDGPDDERRRLFPRRGQTYGRRRLRADGSFADLPATGVGLLFLAFNASITEQFEHVQAVWAENAGFPSLGSSDGAIDPIIGQSPPAPARLPSAWGATGRVDVPAGEPVTRLLGGRVLLRPEPAPARPPDRRLKPRRPGTHVGPTTPAGSPCGLPPSGVEPCRRSGPGGARAEHAELVALGIGEHHPRHVALAHIRAGGAERDEPSDLHVAIIGTEVEVKPVPDRLRLGDRHEQEPGEPVRSGLISSSSGSSLTVTHPSASCHHRPSRTGSAAATVTCSHSSATTTG
jgi:hypothetical protein